jgi:hypothetical protein
VRIVTPNDELAAPPISIQKLDKSVKAVGHVAIA